MSKFPAYLKQVLPFLIIGVNFWGILMAVNIVTHAHVTDFYVHPESDFEQSSYADLWEPRAVKVDPGTIAERAGLQTGDILLTINAQPVFAFPGSPLYLPVSEMHLEIIRDGNHLTIHLPSLAIPREDRLSGLVISTVAFIYWLISILCWMTGTSHRLTVLFFWQMQASVAMWWTGYQYQADYSSGRFLFLLVTPLMGMTLLNFCNHFPIFIHPRSALVRFAWTGLGIIWLIIALCLLFPSLPLWYLIRRCLMLYTGLTILAGLSILLLNYRQHDLFARRQSRLLLVGIMAAILPALFLSFIPQYFFNRPGIPFEWTFPTAVILPLTYIYAMRAGNLGQFDLFLNRSLVYGIVWLIGAGGYLLLYQVLSPVLSGGIILLILLILSDPLRRIASHQVDQLFYGGWYDYRTLVQTASAQLSRAQSLSELTEQLLYVARAMRFHEMVVIWWHGQDRDPLVTSQGLTLALDSDLLAQLPTLLANEHLKSIIVKDKILLVLPVLNRGIMLLGERRGEMALDESDHDILRTIREQASVAAAHITRLEEVAAIRDELIERQRRLTDTRESERLHLAQEIHDGPLQELYGLRFQLSTWETGTLPQTIDIRLQHISDTLRMICSELRPPVLAAFGLELALDAYLDPFRQQYPHVCFTLDLELDYALDERVQMMAFRVVQEGVNNALKHADPRYITIRARTREIADRLTLSLSIEDDGQGFPQPVAVHLRDAVRSGHLGLLGMTERVQAVGGTLVFHSAPGSGTSIQAEVELKKNG